MPLRTVILAVLLGASLPLAAAEAGDAEARKAQVRHDQAAKAAELEVRAKQRDVDNLDHAIDENDKRLAKLEKDIGAAKTALDEVLGAKEKLADAKAAMDAADARVTKEFQQNHNPNSNTGGATDEAVKAQEVAQKEYQRLKRVAASADTEAATAKQHVSALESQRKSEERKKDDNLKKLETAKAAVEAAKQKLADVQAAPVEAKPADQPAPAPQDGAKKDAEPAKDAPPPADPKPADAPPAVPAPAPAP